MRWLARPIGTLLVSLLLISSGPTGQAMAEEHPSSGTTEEAAVQAGPRPLHPYSTLSVTAGSTAGPGQPLSLTLTTMNADTWYGPEWKAAIATTWSSSGATGPAIYGQPALLNWTVPVTPGDYHVRATASLGGGLPYPSNVLTLTVPAPPTKPDIDEDPAGGYRISWSPSPTPGIAGYDIYRISATDTIRLNEAPVSALEFVDAPGQYGADYAVRAVTVSGIQSNMSSRVSAYKPRPYQPAPESWTNATPALRWSYYTMNVVNNRVQIKDANGNVFFDASPPITPAGNARTIPEGIITSPGTYYWRARVWSGQLIPSLWSDWTMVRVDMTPPTLTLNPVSVSAGIVTVSWVGSDTESGIATYLVAATDQSTGTPATVQTSAADSTATFTGISGHSYAISVTAYDNAHNGDPRNFGHSTTATATVAVDGSAPVAEITVPQSGLAGEPASISWQASDPESGVSRSEVSVSKNGGAAMVWQTSSDPSGSAEYTPDGAGTFLFSYRAMNTNGDWSDLETGSMTVVTDAYEPNDTLQTAHSVQVGTAYSAKVRTASDVDYYRLTPDRSGRLELQLASPAGLTYAVELLDGNGTVLRSGQGTTVVLQQDLTGDVPYVIRISGSSGAFSATESYTLTLTYHEGPSETPNPGTPPAPTLPPILPAPSVSHQSVSSSGATIQWSQLTDPVKYVISVNGSSYADVYPGGSLSYALTGLAPNTTYSVSVSAVDQWNRPGKPGTTSFTTLTDRPPAPVVSVTLDAYDSVTINWTPVGSGVFKIDCGPVTETYWGGESYSIRERLGSDRDYIATVTGYNWNLSQLGDPGTKAFHTPKIPAPTNLRVTELSSDRVTLEWDPIHEHKKVYLEGDEYLWESDEVWYYDLTPCTTYTFQVRGYDGNNGELASIEFTTLCDGSGSSSSTYLVGFTDLEARDAALSENHLKLAKVVHKYPNTPVIAVKLPPRGAEALRKDQRVAFVEEDAVVQATATGSWNVGYIGADTVHATGATGTGVTVAILDTGVGANGDLPAVSQVAFGGLPPEGDENGHGTHVAGIVAAMANEQGATGVAPGATLYSLKVLDAQGKGRYSDIIAALEWAMAHKVQIVNMSFSGPTYSKALEQAVQTAARQGMLLVAAAGNNGDGATDTIGYPAQFGQVLSVGAVDAEGHRADFSSVGHELDLTAPGVGILSTLPDGSFSELSGTSMAAPHVSGAAALIWAKRPDLDSAAISQALLKTATAAGHRKEYGSGIVNAQAAYEQLVGPAKKRNPPPVDQTTVHIKPDRGPKKPSGAGGEVAAETLNLNAPPAPTLWAADVSETSVTLQWDSGDTADYYLLLRLDQANGWWELVYSGRDKSYVDTRVAVDQTYVYRVAAATENVWIWSPPSFNGAISVSTRQVAMGAQAHFTVTSTSTSNTLTVAETAVRYYFYKRGSQGLTLVSEQAARTWTDTAVQPNQENAYTVTIDLDGTGKWMTVNGGGSVIVTSPPATPTGLQVTEVGGRYIKVSWQPVSGMASPYGAINYHVLVNNAEVATTQMTSFSVTKLLPDTAYTIGLVAENLAEACSTRTSVSARTLAGGPEVTLTSPTVNQRIEKLIKIEATVAATQVTEIKLYLDGDYWGDMDLGDSTAWAWWRPMPEDSVARPGERLLWAVMKADGQTVQSERVPIYIEVPYLTGQPDGDRSLAEGSESTGTVRLQEIYGLFKARSPLRVGDGGAGADDWVLINGQFNEPRASFLESGEIDPNKPKKTHEGVDLQTSLPTPPGEPEKTYGRPVFAVAGGTVESATDYTDVYGYTVTLRHEVRLSTGAVYPFLTFYAHLAEKSGLAEQSTVSESDLVGISGKTGDPSYPVHLHLEFQKTDESVGGFPYRRAYAPALFYAGQMAGERPWGSDTSFIIHMKVGPDQPGATSNQVQFLVSPVGVGHRYIPPRDVVLHYSLDAGGTWEAVNLAPAADSVTFSYDFTDLNLEQGSSLLYYLTAWNWAWSDVSGRDARAARPWRNWNWSVEPEAYPFLIYIQ